MNIAIMLILITLSLYAQDYKVGDVISLSAKDSQSQIDKINKYIFISKEIDTLKNRKNVLMNQEIKSKEEFESESEYNKRKMNFQLNRIKEIEKIDMSIALKNKFQSNLINEMTFKYVNIQYTYAKQCTCSQNNGLEIIYDSKPQIYNVKMPNSIPVKANVEAKFYTSNSFRRSAPIDIAFEGTIYTIKNPINTISFKYPLDKAKLLRHNLGFLFAVEFKKISKGDQIYFFCDDDIGYGHNRDDKVNNIQLDVDIKQIIAYDTSNNRILYIYNNQGTK